MHLFHRQKNDVQLIIANNLDFNVSLHSFHQCAFLLQDFGPSQVSVPAPGATLNSFQGQLCTD